MNFSDDWGAEYVEADRIERAQLREIPDPQTGFLAPGKSQGPDMRLCAFIERIRQIFPDHATDVHYVNGRVIVEVKSAHSTSPAHCVRRRAGDET